MTQQHPHVAPAREAPAILNLAEARTAVVRGRDIPAESIGGFYDDSFRVLTAFLRERSLTAVGPAFALHTRMPGQTMDLEVGFAIDHPLSGEHATEDGTLVHASVLPGGAAATVSHLDGYEQLAAAWSSLMEWVQANGHTPGLPFWEVYVTGPSPDGDPAAMRTDLYLPVDR